MGNAINPASESAYYRNTGHCKLGAQLMGDLSAIGSCPSRANHRHQAVVVRRQFAYYLQDRRVVVNFSQSSRVIVVVPCDGFDAGRACAFQVLVRVYFGTVFCDVAEVGLIKTGAL